MTLDSETTISDHLAAYASDTRATLRYMRETGADNRGEAELAAAEDELDAVRLNNRIEHWRRTGEWR